MQLDFTGKTAVVTGGAHGIGLAAARTLEACGASVWVFDIEPGDSPHSVRADVTSTESLAAAFERCGAPDVVVANAGVVDFAPFIETSRASWDRMLAVNLTGVFLTVQNAARLMRPRRSGAIVVTASTNSFEGESNLAAYNATKAGLLGIVRTAANELGPYGIRVNAVCPGIIRTRMNEQLFTQSDVIQPYLKQIPLGRSGETQEVARSIAFLASDLASYITGAALFVDGGQMAAKFATWDGETAEFSGGRWRLR